MIPKNTKKIINLLLRSIDRPGFNVNQLAKELKISPGNAHLIVKDLKKKNIINSIDLKTSIYYTLNLENEESRILAQLTLLDQKRNLPTRASIYANDIEKFPAEIIILFGSILEKQDFNDVDVLFIIKDKKQVKEVNDFCLKLSGIRTKTISPLISTLDDFKTKLNDEVVLDIIKKGVIIKGTEKFIDIIKNATRK